jgi:dTDP-4-dehydrorhamnose 3,5-epimerase
MKVHYIENIPELIVIEPDVYGDQRGWFAETWQKNKYKDVGISKNFVQDNMSFSKKGTLRGLHMQKPEQGKLVQVIEGEIFDVAVDLRMGSSTFGKWHGIILSGTNKKQFWVPEGFAHGFYVMSDTATFTYKCTEFYNSKNEISVLWNDPGIGITWPVKESPLLSNKDANAEPLKWWVEKNLLL